MMPVENWVALFIGVPAAMILAAICVIGGARMTMKEARSQRPALIVSAVVLLLVAGIESLTTLGGIAVLGFGLDIIGFVAGCMVLYTFCVGLSLMFRHRLRWIGLQLLTVSALAIGLVAIVVPDA